MYNIEYNKIMIELIERKNVFEDYKIIASETAKIQEALFDNAIYSDIEDYNEKIEYKNIFDAIDYKKYNLKYNEKILTCGHNDLKTFTKILFDILLNLFEAIDISELFILVDLKIDFYKYLFNKYKPLVNAYKKLKKITEKMYYTEAFYLNKLSEEIVDIIFWLSRCCPSMNNIIFFDKMERYYLSVCQYGNIHITGLNENFISDEIVNKSGLKIIEGREMDNFSKDQKINGRRLKIYTILILILEE